MSLFLQIVLAVVLVIALVGLVGFWRFRRSLPRNGVKVGASVALLGGGGSRPARVCLHEIGYGEAGEQLRAEWSQWHALGFQELGDYSDDLGGFAFVRLAADPERRFALALAEDDAGKVVSALFVLTDRKRLLGSSDGLGVALDTSSAWWTVDRKTPEMRVALMQARVGDAELLPTDARMVKRLFERAYALITDAELMAGPPRRTTIEARAARRTPPADAAQVDEAMRLGYAIWRERMEQAALDNWRRASRVDAVTWERIEADVHVVYNAMRDEDVRDLLCCDEQSERVFEQLVVQGMNGIQLYEELMQRLPEHLRRQRFGEVRRPVRAVLYARAEDSGEEGEGRALAGQAQTKPSPPRSGNGTVLGARILTEPSLGVSALAVGVAGAPGQRLERISGGALSAV